MTELCTIKTVAERLAVSEMTVRRWITQYRQSRGARGLGPAVVLGHSTLRLPVAAVEAFVAERSGAR